MRAFRLTKFFTIVLLTAVIISQCFLGFNYLTKPTPAKAVLGIGDISFDFSTQIANPYDIAKDIFKAALVRIATNYTNEFMNRFVDKALDKYKIRNYLYYDKVLTSYYLNQYIADKIGDPDLRDAFQAASTLYSYDLTGSAGVTARQKQAALKRLKDAQAKYHLGQGGIAPDKIYNPPAGTTDREYFAMARAYFANPQSFSAQQLNEQFAAIQSSSAAASGQEISSGNGLKSSRQILTITASGSVGLDRALSIINNPSGFIQSHLESAIQTIFNTNTDVGNNPYAAIGSALGNFVFKRLQLDSDDDNDVLNEYDEIGYTADDGTTPAFVEIDLDGDGIPDGRDTDNSGTLRSISDVCYHGGSPIEDPGCNKSSQVGSSPYFTPLCQALDKAAKDGAAFVDFATLHQDQVNGDNFRNDADVQSWSRRARTAYSSLDNLQGTVQEFNNPYFDNTEIALGRYADYLNAINMSLAKDKDLELDGQYGSYDGVSNIIEYTGRIVDYIRSVKAAIGQCANPNAQAASNVPVPPGVPPPASPPPGPPGTPPPPGSGGVGTGNSQFNCAPGDQIANVDQPVTVNAIGTSVGSGDVNWSAPGAAGATNGSGNSFTTSYHVSDGFTITGTLGGLAAQCQVRING